jgi:hypothetical protein
MNAHREQSLDAGPRVVERLYELSRIDPEWSVRRSRGFTWWAGPLAQHVWADPLEEFQGQRLSRVHARTDVFAGFGESEQELLRVGALAGMSTLSSWVRDPQDPARIQLAAAVSAHASGEGFLSGLMALAAAIQVAEAHILAPALERVPGWRSAASSHPAGGPRSQLDDMLNVIEGFVAPLGREDSRWAGADMEKALRLLQQPPCVLANGSLAGLAGEFPFPGPTGTSLFTLTTTAPHPRLGNGCLCRLTLPHGGEDAATARLALQLNGFELDGFAYHTGSWCPSDRGLAYVSFLPNAAHQPGALENIVMSFVSRVRWVARAFFEYDMDEHFEESLARKQEQMDGFAKRIRTDLRESGSNGVESDRAPDA